MRLFNYPQESVGECETTLYNNEELYYFSAMNPKRKSG